MAENVKATGFTLRCRNANPSSEAAVAFDWLAVLGGPEDGVAQIDALVSVLQAKSFGDFLHRRHWPRIWFSVPFFSPSPRAVLLTANDLGVQGARNPAVVGVVNGLESLPALDTDGFSVRATNLDSIDGASGFYAAAFAIGDPATPTGSATQAMWIDHGSEENTEDFFLNVFPGTPYPVNPGGQDGDSRDFAIYFDRSFLAPLVVLATARGRTPVVLLARDVTTHGFTLHARNTDSVGGHALFYWAAIGCVDGCG